MWNSYKKLSYESTQRLSFHLKPKRMFIIQCNNSTSSILLFGILANEEANLKGLFYFGCSNCCTSKRSMKAKILPRSVSWTMLFTTTFYYLQVTQKPGNGAVEMWGGVYKNSEPWCNPALVADLMVWGAILLYSSHNPGRESGKQEADIEPQTSWWQSVLLWIRSKFTLRHCHMWRRQIEGTLNKHSNLLSIQWIH